MSARRLAVALAAASSMAAIGAFAAGADIDTSTIASGSDPVTACDSTPTWEYEFLKGADGKVSQVVVSTIDAACANGQLSLTVTPGGAQGSSSVMGCTTECAVTVSLDTPLVPGDVDNVAAIILGP